MHISHIYYCSLENELQRAITKRETIKQEFQEAVELGDDRENAQLDTAKYNLDMNEKKIAELEKIIRDHEVYTGSDQVVIGSIIDLLDDDLAKHFNIVIAGYTFQHEDYPLAVAITAASPIATGLLGKESNAMIKIDLPSGLTKSLQIKGIVNS